MMMTFATNIGETSNLTRPFHFYFQQWREASARLVASPLVRLS